MSLRDRIIHEALRQFSLKGFMSTSISDLLVSVGTSKGGLYNYFLSKEDLYAGAREIWPAWTNCPGLWTNSRSSWKITGITIWPTRRIFPAGVYLSPWRWN